MVSMVVSKRRTGKGGENKKCIRCDKTPDAFFLFQAVYCFVRRVHIGMDVSLGRCKFCMAHDFLYHGGRDIPEGERRCGRMAAGIGREGPYADIAQAGFPLGIKSRFRHARHIADPALRRFAQLFQHGNYHLRKHDRSFFALSRFKAHAGDLALFPIYHIRFELQQLARHHARIYHYQSAAEDARTVCIALPELLYLVLVEGFGLRLLQLRQADIVRQIRAGVSLGHGAPEEMGKERFHIPRGIERIRCVVYAALEVLYRERIHWARGKGLHPPPRDIERGPF